MEAGPSFIFKKCDKLIDKCVRLKLINQEIQIMKKKGLDTRNFEEYVKPNIRNTRKGQR